VGCSRQNRDVAHARTHTDGEKIMTREHATILGTAFKNIRPASS
jgi:hypothetical protein